MNVFAKLTNQQQDIFRCIQHRADWPIPAILKFLPYRAHSVNYSLKQLKDHGLIKLRPYIDLLKLGYTSHNMLLSLAKRESKARVALIDFLVASPSLGYLAEIGGNYDLDVTIFVESPECIVRLFTELSDRFGPVFEQKLISTESCFNYYGVKYLGKSSIPVPPLIIEGGTKTVALDQLDRKLLQAMSLGMADSSLALSRMLKVPNSTINYRLQKMKKERILVSMAYSLNWFELGHTFYHFKATAIDLSRKFHNSFLKFCAEHPHVYCCHRCFGAWDYKIDIIGEHSNQVTTTLQEISERFGANFRSIISYPVIKHRKLGLAVLGR